MSKDQTTQAAEPKTGKVKDKRSKAQIKLDSDSAEMKQLLESWMKYKSMIALAFSARPITDDAEQQFREVTGALQRQQRGVMKFIPRDIGFGTDLMTNLMKDSVSVQHLRDLPEYDKKKLYNNWHKVYILMTRATGAMQFIAEGFVHVVKAKQEVDIRGMKKNIEGEKVPPYKNPTVVTLVLVGFVVATFVLAYTGVVQIPFLFGN